MSSTLVATAFLALAFDQAAKAVVVGARPDNVRPRRLRICRHVRNPGRIRLLRRPFILLALWTIEITLLLALASAGPWFVSKAAHVGFGLVMGGATSNLLDRLARGAVIDFVDLRIWPVFNIADAAIVCGVLMVALSPI